MVVSRYTIEQGKQRRTSFIQHAIPVVALIAIVGGGYTIYTDKDAANVMSEQVSAQSVVTPNPRLNITAPLPWPDYGQSAYGTVSNGTMPTSMADNTKQVPTASLAKVITALAVLKQKPLEPGQQGPMITLTSEDIAIYNEYVRNSGAVVQIEEGEQISQYQALQAMLQPSANNMADALARWAFGSIDAYNVYANAMVKELNITNTTISDASGFSPKTTSTASDMVELGKLYIQNSLLKEIALQTGSTIPFVGPIKNYNATLNKDGVVGIKIGNTDEAGRCFLVADIRDNGVISIAATMGAEELSTAMNDAVSLLKAGNTEYDKLVVTQP